jgi:hypothetical protein
MPQTQGVEGEVPRHASGRALDNPPKAGKRRRFVITCLRRGFGKQVGLSASGGLSGRVNNRPKRALNIDITGSDVVHKVQNLNNRLM